MSACLTTTSVGRRTEADGVDDAAGDLIDRERIGDRVPRVDRTQRIAVDEPPGHAVEHRTIWCPGRSAASRLAASAGRAGALTARTRRSWTPSRRIGGRSDGHAAVVARHRDPAGPRRRSRPERVAARHHRHPCPASAASPRSSRRWRRHRQRKCSWRCRWAKRQLGKGPPNAVPSAVRARSRRLTLISSGARTKREAILIDPVLETVERDLTHARRARPHAQIHDRNSYPRRSCDRRRRGFATRRVANAPSRKKAAPNMSMCR